MPVPRTIKRNTENLISEEELISLLKENRPLKIKLGVDPTRPDLTFGHMVVFNKLRDFQDLGHEAVLIIGDFTTLIGDPSGQSALRPVLDRKTIGKNADTYLQQAFKILDESRTTIRRNSEWFGKMGFEDALSLARKMTVARMLERDDFSRRHARNDPISIVEFLYPLLQGYDSLMVNADIELGGSDQLFNLLVGRSLQREAGKREQVVITTPLLIGLDGTRKMSKSLDNYIAFNDSSKDIFGKIMSLGDDLMWDYYRILLHASKETIEKLKKNHPMAVKKDLALRLTAKLFNPEIAQRERDQFEKVFARKEAPDTMPNFSWERLSPSDAARLLDLLAASGLFPSKKEARRLIEQGALKINGRRCRDPRENILKPAAPLIIQAGKRLFFRITP